MATEAELRVALDIVALRKDKENRVGSVYLLNDAITELVALRQEVAALKANYRIARTLVRWHEEHH